MTKIAVPSRDGLEGERRGSESGVPCAGHGEADHGCAR
jgi:hypothetical protein